MSAETIIALRDRVAELETLLRRQDKHDVLILEATRDALRDLREAVVLQGDAGWTFSPPLQDALAAADRALGEE